MSEAKKIIMAIIVVLLLAMLWARRKSKGHGVTVGDITTISGNFGDDLFATLKTGPQTLVNSLFDPPNRCAALGGVYVQDLNGGHCTLNGANLFNVLTDPRTLLPVGDTPGQAEGANPTLCAAECLGLFGPPACSEGGCSGISSAQGDGCHCSGFYNGAFSSGSYTYVVGKGYASCYGYPFCP